MICDVSYLKHNCIISRSGGRSPGFLSVLPPFFVDLSSLKQSQSVDELSCLVSHIFHGGLEEDLSHKIS